LRFVPLQYVTVLAVVLYKKELCVTKSLKETRGEVNYLKIQGNTFVDFLL